MNNDDPQTPITHGDALVAILFVWIALVVVGLGMAAMEQISK